MSKKFIRIYVADGDSTDWPPDNLVELIAWLKNKLSEIPEEHRGVATCEISSEGGDDWHMAHMDISYHREETEKEIEERLADEKQHRENRAKLEVELARMTLRRHGAL